MTDLVQLSVVVLAVLFSGCQTTPFSTIGSNYSGAIKDHTVLMELSHDQPYGYDEHSTAIPARYGKASERFEIRHGDCATDENGWSDCEYDRQRIEKAPRNTNTMQRYGSERWYGWSIYLPRDFPDLAPTNTTLVQWKMFGWRDPILNFIAKTGHFSFKLYALGQKRECPMIRLSDIRGRWLDIMLHIKWTTENDGFVAVYLDGEEIRCSVKNTPTILASAKPRHWDPKIQYGIYHSFVSRWLSRNAKNKVAPTIWQDVQHDNKVVNISVSASPFKTDWGIKLPTVVVHYDEFRVGNSREEVNIRMIEARNGEAVE